MTADIRSNTPQGWPEPIRHRFDVPLEDPSLLRLRFDTQQMTYEPFTLSAIGEELQL